MAATEQQISEARAMRKQAQIIATDATDQHASQAVEFYPVMDYDGSLIKVGTRINWKGSLKKAKTDLWDREDCDPKHAPGMWDDVAYRNGVRVIPFTRQAFHDTFYKDELGWWNGDDQAKAGVWASPSAGTCWAPGTTGVKWVFVRNEA